MSTEHTSEPWPDPNYDNSDTSASEWWDIPGIGRFWKEGDALRVQAAVNACAGYDTVALQGAGTGYFHRAIRDMIAEIKKKDAALENKLELFRQVAEKDHQEKVNMAAEISRLIKATTKSN